MLSDIQIFSNKMLLLKKIIIIVIKKCNFANSFTMSLSYSHKKQKDSLKTRPALLVFLLEHQISEGIHQNSQNYWLQ